MKPLKIWMRMPRRRPLPCAVAVTFMSALTIYHTILAFSLIPTSSKNTTRAFHESFDNLKTPILIPNSAATHQLYFRSTLGRMDTSLRYKIHDFLIVGKKWDQVSTGPMCLATQTSLDRLSSLGEVATEWQGPVSVTVFAPDQEFFLALRYVAFLQNCFPAVNDNVSFHLVYPNNRPPAYNSRVDEPLVMNCNKLNESLTRILKLRPLSMMEWRVMTPYPQNHARNVARKNCQSPYVFQIDVDIIPRRGLALSLARFVRKPDLCARCSFVVPTYEVDARVTQLPVTKSELVQLVNERLAQRLHGVVFVDDQTAMNHSRWEKMPETEEIDAAYVVSNYNDYYEPFYVAKDSVPPHDERFIGYGNTRNTQVFEMVSAGYTSWVLNNAFALHRGFTAEKKTRPFWRKKQNGANAHLWIAFKEEVFVKYRNSKVPNPPDWWLRLARKEAQ